MSTSMGEENHRRDQDRDRRADADGLTHHDPHDTGRTSPSKEHRPAGHDSLRTQQKERFGGMKFGAAFFGWLTAVGLTVLLAALVAGTGSAIGFSTDTTVQDAANNTKDVGIGGAVALLVILLIAYFAGGYVAGRMARFDGAKQGIAVWLWAVLVAIVIAVLGLIAGDRFVVLSQLDALPSIPVSTHDATTTAIIALIAVAATTLVGAILGGITGMRYHRKIDNADYTLDQPRDLR